MKHDSRTHNLQHIEACLILAAFEGFGRQAFTRNELAVAADLPINTVCGRTFTLVRRGAFEECGRRGRSELLRIVIKQPRRGNGKGKR